mgnify:CR=1 FL=1
MNQVEQDLLGLCLNSDWIEVDTLGVLLGHESLDVALELMLLPLNQEVIADNGYALPVVLSHIGALIELADMAVQTEHVEVGVDGQDMVACLEVER